MTKCRRVVIRCLVWFGALTALVVIVVPFWHSVCENRSNARVAKSLVMIGMALKSYHDDYGSFPPAFVADDTGKPKHSWRVLLLPYLGCNELYKRYNFEDPWNGDNNRAVAEEVCDIYGSTLAPHGQGTVTRYLAVVGPDTAWPGQRGRQIADIRDGLSQTILLLDCVDSDVKWAEPRDLSYREALSLEGTGEYLRIARDRPQGVLYLDAGCVLGTLPSNFSTDLLRSLLTIRGGERVEGRWLKEVPKKDKVFTAEKGGD